MRPALTELAGKGPSKMGTSPKAATYLPLIVPIILFIASLYIPPGVSYDPSAGFRVLQNMLNGGAFNTVTVPDPANIAQDVIIFQTWWSPGQYLVPGSFIWLGSNYGLALSFTALIATLIGVVGWIQVARSFAVTPFVLSIFVLGLCTFSYVTLPFQTYNGGEPLLFAVAPWSLHAMRWAVNKPPILSLTISFISAALLFFAKLTGVIVFAANVGAISLLGLIHQRRLTSSITAMWVASAIGALCYLMFWRARGQVPADGSAFSFHWFPIWFSVAGATFSGISGFDFSFWFLSHLWVGIVVSGQQVVEILRREIKLLAYLFGPLGLLLIGWVWLRLRRTPHRDTAILLLSVISLYAVALAAVYLRKADISVEERHFRYAGILFFLLVLTALDQRCVPLAKRLICVTIFVLGCFGLKQYITAAYAQMQRGYYDPMTGISQVVSPTILQYLRSDARQHHIQRPVAVIYWSEVSISLPQFRTILTRKIAAPDEDFEFELLNHRLLDPAIEHRRDAKRPQAKFAGRAEKIFVIVPQEVQLTGTAEAILRSFTGYEFDSWRQTNLDGTIIYTQ
jgi:hypothetical protein